MIAHIFLITHEKFQAQEIFHSENIYEKKQWITWKMRNLSWKQHVIELVSHQWLLTFLQKNSEHAWMHVEHKKGLETIRKMVFFWLHETRVKSNNEVIRI